MLSVKNFMGALLNENKKIIGIVYVLVLNFIE
jgi:hypothetical protein